MNGDIAVRSMTASICVWAARSAPRMIARVTGSGARAVSSRPPPCADQEIAGAIDGGALPGRHHGRRVELLDDRRTRHHGAHAQPVSVDAWARRPAGAGEVDAPPDRRPAPRAAVV